MEDVPGGGARCPNGHVASPGQRFCGECGAPLTATTLMSESETPSGARANVHVRQNEVTASANQQPEAPIATRRLTVLPMAIGVIVIVLIAGLFVQRGSKETVLESAYKTCTDKSSDKSSVPLYAELGDDGRSLILDGPGEGGGHFQDSFDFDLCIMSETHMPDYIKTKVTNTSSLMGQQTGEWETIEASWSFHPDNGLDLVLHVN